MHIQDDRELIYVHCKTKDFVNLILEGNSCLISEKKHHNIAYTYDKIIDIMGKTYKNVILMDIENITANVFCILSGVISRGGKLLIISGYALEEMHKLNYKIYINFSGAEKYFFKRFFKMFAERCKTFLIDEVNEINNLINLENNLIKENTNVTNLVELSNVIEDINKINYERNEILMKMLLTQSQICAYESIITKLHKNVLITSERGCGKTYLLGVLTTYFILTKYNKIALINANDVLLGVIKQNLDKLNVKYLVCKDKIKIFDFIEKEINFNSGEIYIVDEAASLPVYKIKDFLKNKSIFATTEEGYEGTSRSFTHKIIKNSKIMIYKLNENIRYNKNDTLSVFLNSCFLFNAKIKNVTEIKNNFTFEALNKKDLYENEELLNEVYALLSNEHYRNSPDELLFIFDNSLTNICVLKDDLNIVGVILYAIEVNTNDNNKSGNLIKNLMQEKYFDSSFINKTGIRILRIVIHPQLRRKGLGKIILSKFLELSDQNNNGYIGVSFGLTYELLNFWQKNSFFPLYLCKERCTTTGENTIIMLYKIKYDIFIAEFMNNLYFSFRNLNSIIILQLIQPFKNDLIRQKVNFNDFEKRKINNFLLNSSDPNKVIDFIPRIAEFSLFHDNNGLLEQLLLVKVGLLRYNYREFCEETNLPQKYLISVVNFILRNALN